MEEQEEENEEEEEGNPCHVVGSKMPQTVDCGDSDDFLDDSDTAAAAAADNSEEAIEAAADAAVMAYEAEMEEHLLTMQELGVECLDQTACEEFFLYGGDEQPEALEQTQLEEEEEEERQLAKPPQPFFARGTTEDWEQSSGTKTAACRDAAHLLTRWASMLLLLGAAFQAMLAVAAGAVAKRAATLLSQARPTGSSVPQAV